MIYCYLLLLCIELQNSDLGVCRYIDTNQEVYIERLSETVAIRSVSGCPELRGEVTKMVQYVAKVVRHRRNLSSH